MVIQVEADGGQVTDRTMVGVVAGRERVKLPVTQVPRVMWDQISGTVKAYGRLPVAVWETARDTFLGEERDPTGSPMSIVGVARLQGEITAESPQGNQGDVWTTWLSLWLSIGATLNLALWLFNLVPLLPLDGGHVLGAVIEGTRRTWARVRRRPPTGPIYLARAVPVAYVVFILIVVMTLILVWADIVNPIPL